MTDKQLRILVTQGFLMPLNPLRDGTYTAGEIETAQMHADSLIGAFEGDSPPTLPEGATRLPGLVVRAPKKK